MMSSSDTGTQLACRERGELLGVVDHTSRLCEVTVQGVNGRIEQLLSRSSPLCACRREQRADVGESLIEHAQLLRLKLERLNGVRVCGGDHWCPFDHLTFAAKHPLPRCPFGFGEENPENTTVEESKLRNNEA